MKKVAILANGGDVSGFNAVIRGIVKTAEQNNVKCYGIIEGYKGLLENNFVELNSYTKCFRNFRQRWFNNRFFNKYKCIQLQSRRKW